MVRDAVPTDDHGVIVAARQLADEVLAPSASEVDASPLVPLERLDALAAAGFYGLAGPRSAGGLGVDRETFFRAVEELASGCLTTAFVLGQHHGALRAVEAGPPALRDRLLAPLCSGAVRAGIAYAGLRRPGPPPLRARDEAGGWRLEGRADWVSGFGRVDLLLVGARTDAGDVLWCLVEARPGAQLAVTPLGLGAMGASGTVSLSFSGLLVDPEAVIGVEEDAQWRRRDAASLRANGSFALGLGRRCLLLLGEAGPNADHPALATARARLDRAANNALAAARAEAALLAHRLAARLVARTGGRAVLRGDPAERLAREASFLLVFGQTAAIKGELLERLSPAP
ncbi:MAG: acyl-CoA/acyl-ACP dehydrogenase [Actinomycetota bacterium]|nr:acyl-CoA/acyl-ACP dehydrogenase [Actinomycetota bacterium]